MNELRRLNTIPVQLNNYITIGQDEDNVVPSIEVAPIERVLLQQQIRSTKANRIDDGGAPASWTIEETSLVALSSIHVSTALLHNGD